MAMSDKERFEQKVARQPTGPLPVDQPEPPKSTNPARTEKMGLADPENPETAEEAREAEKARTKRRIERDLKRNKGEDVPDEDGEHDDIASESNQPLEPPETEEQVKAREAKAKPDDKPAQIAPQDQTKGFDRDTKRS